MLCIQKENLQEPKATWQCRQPWQQWEAFTLQCVLLWSLPVFTSVSLQFLKSSEPSPKVHTPRHHWVTDINTILRRLLNSWRQIPVKKIRIAPFREVLQNYLTEFLEHEQQQQGKMSALIWCGFLLNAEWFIKALNRWQVWQPSVCAMDRFIMLLVLKYLCRNRLSEINDLVHKSILLKAAVITAISIKLCNEILLSIL